MTAIDKSKELHVSLKTMNDKLHFMGRTDDQNPVSIDYTPPLGDNLGYTSLELLLLSLGSCIGSAVLVLLRKMGKTVRGLEIEADGIRRQEHPTSFSSITLTLVVNSPDTTEADLDRAVGLADEKLCPVYAMIKGNVEVIVKRSVSA